MGSFLIPAIALILAGAPLEGTILAYFVVSGATGIIRTMGDVAHDIQAEVRLAGSNGLVSLSMFSSRGRNNGETPAVASMHSPEHK